jgi:hypothetical protein
VVVRLLLCKGWRWVEPNVFTQASTLQTAQLTCMQSPEVLGSRCKSRPPLAPCPSGKHLRALVLVARKCYHDSFMMSWCRQARVAGVLALLLLSAIALADDQGHNKRTKADKDEIENEESETPMGAPVDEEEQLRADGVLAQQLKLAVQAQKERKLNKTEAMKLLLTSRIVPEAGNASLWAGIGDVPTTGAPGRGNTAPTRRLHVNGSCGLTGAWYLCRELPGRAGALLPPGGAGAGAPGCLHQPPAGARGIRRRRG